MPPQTAIQRGRHSVFKLLTDFKAFLLQGNLILLAIAFIMGTVFATLLKAFIADLITPIIGLIIGKPSFGNLVFTIHHSQFHYGDFINVGLTFIITGFAVFFFIAKPYEHFQKEDTSVRNCPECTSAIPSAASRCPMCTAQIGPALPTA
jgi:large conductance mechanosensitive channel